MQDALLNRPIYCRDINHVSTLQKHLDSSMKRKEKKNKTTENTKKLDFTFFQQEVLTIRYCFPNSDWGDFWA